METDKLSVLTEKINRALKQPQFPKIQRLEFDLLMQHVRELYDELDTIRNKKGEHEVGRPNYNKRESMQPEELLIRRTLHTNEHFLLNDIHPRQEEGEEPVVKKPEQRAPVKPETQEQAPSKASINESIRFPGSLNERLKSSTGTEVHKAIASKHLKDMIDLNKRFVLVNELFKGNKEQFTMVVNYIDGCADYTTAETYIRTQLSAANNWDVQSEPARLFMELVGSKFDKG